jgi:2-polyprenyl-3-methyl-5-hydroxy-6-metoxy-1,4-benzoquinol methylase
MLANIARRIDSFFIQHLGLPYSLATRDWMIHERMQYLTAWVGRVAGEVRVLDAGCGSGLSLLYLHKYHPNRVREYVGIDLRTERLRERYGFVGVPHRFLDVDLDSNWRLGLFDVIFCSEVIEHVIEDQRLFSRLCTHLNKQGVLVLTTPNKAFVSRFARVLPGFDAISAVQDGGHVRIGYEPAELEWFGRSNGMASVGCCGLGCMSIRQLRKRHAMMKEGQYVNTQLFNLLRLLRPTGPGAPQCNDNCWTLAMVFAKKLEGEAVDECYAGGPTNGG